MAGWKIDEGKHKCKKPCIYKLFLIDGCATKQEGISKYQIITMGLCWLQFRNFGLSISLKTSHGTFETRWKTERA